MKTLIFNGSPRINGDTASLLKVVRDSIAGEYKVVNAYCCDISACMDCRFCWKESGCAIQDEMQEVYDYIQECDNILIASPIYFRNLQEKCWMWEVVCRHIFAPVFFERKYQLQRISVEL